MARGRHQKWICKHCKAEFYIQGEKPALCCFCGSDDLCKAQSLELALSFEKKKEELDCVCKQLNPVYDEFSILKSKYDELMAYWKQQKQRGYISKEEFNELASKFKGGRSKN